MYSDIKEITIKKDDNLIIILMESGEEIKIIFNEVKYDNPLSGTLYYFMDNLGRFSCIGTISPDNSCYILSDLGVNKKERNKGYGTILQKMREYHANSLGINTLYLFVEKGTSLEERYKKRGYIPYILSSGKMSDEDPDDKNNIWLKKIV